MMALVAEALATSAYACVALNVRGNVQVKESPAWPLAASDVGIGAGSGRLMPDPPWVTATVKFAAGPPLF